MSSTPEIGRLLTYKETADLLRVTVRTVRTWAKSGDLRAVRLGPGAVRFDPADVADFIAARRTGGRSSEGEAGQ
jgi:excisionase family DNA binding protein